MKILFFVSIALNCVLGYTQTDTVSIKTALESFTIRSGSILEKKVFDIGEMDKIKIKVIQVKDLTTNQKIAGVIIETKVPTLIGSEIQPSIAYLDIDEIDGLIKAIKFIKVSLDSVPIEFTEIRYSSRGNFEFGIFLENKKWMPYFKIAKFTNSTVYLKETEIDYFLQRIIECQSKLTLLLTE